MPFKRGKTWYTDIRPRGADGKPLLDSKGKPVRIRKRIPHVKYKPEAEKAERKIAARLLYGEEEEVIVPFFEDFVREVYLPWAKEHHADYGHDKFRAEMLMANAHFKGKRLNEIAEIQIEGFKSERLKSKTRYGRLRSPSTVNVELAVVRNIFKRAVRRGIIARNPAEDVKFFDAESLPTRRLAPKEEKAIFKEMLNSAAFLVPVSIIAINTGLRAGEIARLKVEDVDFARDLLFPQVTKVKRDKRKTEGVPMNATVRALLWKLCRERKTGRLFFNSKGEPLTRAHISNSFRRARMRAGVNGFRFHDLRHEFGSRIGDLGYSPYDIARLMGHMDIKTSLIYVHPQEKSLKNAVREIDSSTFGHSADTKGKRQAGNAASKRLKRRVM